MIIVVNWFKVEYGVTGITMEDFNDIGLGS